MVYFLLHILMGEFDCLIVCETVVYSVDQHSFHDQHLSWKMELFWPCGYKGGHLFQVLILNSTLILECILIASPLNLLPISILVAWIHPHLPPLLQRVLISIASLGIRLILPPANLTAPYKPANLVAPIILASLTAPEIPNKLTAPDFLTKGGSAVIGALKILALPKRGGGSDQCQDFLVDL